MIGEDAFKGLCNRTKEGLAMRALFITPTAALRSQQQLDMLNMGADMDLNPLANYSTRTVTLGKSRIWLRIAHPYIDEELKGLEWHFIHGLNYLDKYPEGESIAANLQMRVRS